MTPILPCPNPACGHFFTAADLRDARQLVCPRCRTVFQFRQGTAPPAPSPPPPPAASLPATLVKPLPRAGTAPKPAPPPAQPPAATPAGVPVARPVGPAPLALASGPELIVSPSRRPRPARGRVLTLALLLAGCLGLGVWGALWLRHILREQDGRGGMSPAEQSRANFGFKAPGPGWEEDDRARRFLGANLALRRSNPSSTVALAYKDYKTTLPGEAEMVDRALRKLRSYFKDTTLEWELKPKAAASLGGVPALVIEFEGLDPDSVTMSGDCYLLRHRGFAYWFFVWGPAGQRGQLAGEWEALRRNFTLGNEREGWRERPPESERVQGKRAPYQLTYVKGIWQAQPLQGYDPLADVVLLGNDPTESPHAGRAATLQVLVLPPQPDLPAASQTARAHLLKRQQDPDGENAPDATVEVVRDKEGADSDRDADVGKLPGRLSKLKVRQDATHARYAVLGVVRLPEHVLVLWFDCDWERREFWDREFQPLMNSLRLVKGR